MDDDAEADDIMQCLIDNKHHPDMDEKCKAGIEHHQLVCTMCHLSFGLWQQFPRSSPLPQDNNLTVPHVAMK